MNFFYFQEIEEKSKERRRKYQKENNRQYPLMNNSFSTSATQNYEKVISFYYILPLTCG